MKIYLTFDVEEWIFPEEYNIKSKYNNNISFSREGCKEVLKLLNKHNIKSTFFITGYFAEREKELVSEINRNEHEIASHAYKHLNLKNLDKKELEKSLKKTSQILFNISKQKIKGFRAPNFSINNKVLDTLKKLNYRYDSSVHPAIVPGYYYNWDCKLEPYYYKNNKLLEIPISVIPIVRMPISWLWMRNLGNWITNIGVNLNKKRDVIIYFHTWEFSKIPRVKGIPFYIEKNTGGAFLNKMDKFLNKFKNHFEFDKLINLRSLYNKNE